jgi:hypothetical protein
LLEIESSQRNDLAARVVEVAKEDDEATRATGAANRHRLLIGLVRDYVSKRADTCTATTATKFITNVMSAVPDSPSMRAPAR